MQPNGSKSVSFNQQFVELLLRFVGIIKQYCCVAYHLLKSGHSYIDRTARKMVTIAGSANRTVKLR